MDKKLGKIVEAPCKMHACEEMSILAKYVDESRKEIFIYTFFF